MPRKLPRWTLVSMFLVLTAVVAFAVWRGTSATLADDKSAGPIVPPGGPKPIPFDTASDAKPDAGDLWRHRPGTSNLLRTSAAGDTAPSDRGLPNNRGGSTSEVKDEPRRLSARVEDATPAASRSAPNSDPTTDFPLADQALNKNGPSAAMGDPLGLHNAPSGEGGRYGVRPASSEIPDVMEKGNGEKRVTAAAGNAPIATDSPAWARDRAGSSGDSSSAAKNPFPTPGSAKPSPWAAEPSATPISETRPENRGETRAPVASPFSPPSGTPALINNPPAKPGAELGAPAAAQLGAAGDGSGRPGGKHLEGSQSPQVTLEKLAPREIQVGKPAVFEIKVRNTGTIVAQGVEIFDEIPKGTQLLRTVPAASRGPRNDLIWTIGALKPGEESKVQVEVMPTTEGEVGSVATVHFRADASARTICTKPELTVQVAAPRQVMIGDDVTFTIKISNPGSGTASGVVLAERVPSGLQHAAGTELEFDVGDLKPNETRSLDLTLKAVTAGMVTNVISARADASLKVTERAELEVIAPGLKVAMTGPTKRFLERQATYTFSVTNPGTATAKEVELTTYLPKGLKFVKANNSGQYDSRRHCVVWSLEELPPTETGAVQMTALPIEEGEQKLRIEAKAQQGLADTQESTITVDGVAAVLFEVADLADPIEVGGETTYEIRVTNQGSKAASNILITAFLPGELKPLAAEGPTKHVIEGSKVTFEPLPRLSPKGDTVFRIRAQALRAGDARVKVQLMADELRQPVTKEESTRVYADE